MNKVKKVIDKNVESAENWRQILVEFWAFINQPNPQIRERIKYELVSDFIFQEDEVLTFQFADGDYGIVILLNIKQYRGECTYQFGTLTYKNQFKPTWENALNEKIVGEKMINDIMILASILDKGIKLGIDIESLQQEYIAESGIYDIGIAVLGVEHKKLNDMCENFESIGNLRLKPDYKLESSLSYVSNFVEFCEEFIDNLKILDTFPIQLGLL